MAAIFSKLPTAQPLLDRSAVEQARLVRLAHEQLATSEPSVDYDGLALGRASSALAARQWTKRQRSKGHLIVVSYAGGTLVPTFQLDEIFNLDERVTPTIKILTTYGLSGWAMWQWFVSVNPWTEQRPIDSIGDESLGRAVAGLTGL